MDLALVVPGICAWATLCFGIGGFPIIIDSQKIGY
jgi:hypothetical protein